MVTLLGARFLQLLPIAQSGLGFRADGPSRAKSGMINEWVGVVIQACARQGFIQEFWVGRGKRGV